MRWLQLTVLILASCSALPDVDQRIETANAKAGAGGFIAERINAGPFTLQAYHTGLDRNADHWHVYLEGDSQAFLTRTRLAPDPTPIDPLGLDDPAPAVLYLGRPCQYRAKGDRRPCASRYWSNHRFADEVVEATASAIESLLARRADPSTGVSLIGYSGGGALAALIAARSPRINRLVTIAGPLDLNAWARHHGVSPLYGSIDPTTIAHRLAMPQVHFRVRQDRVMPPTLQDGFLTRLPPSVDPRVVALDHVDHACCWRRLWPSFLLTFPVDQSPPTSPAGISKASRKASAKKPFDDFIAKAVFPGANSDQGRSKYTLYPFVSAHFLADQVFPPDRKKL